MSEHAASLPPRTGQTLLDSVIQTYVAPELSRRSAAGADREPQPAIFAIQIIFKVGEEPEVRLNEEVRGVARARATRALEKGEQVFAEDMSEVESIDLTDADPDAAHITALQTGDGWYVSWDGRYNATLIAAHREAAAQFMELAEEAVQRGLLRGFVENAFEAAELLAKAEVLMMPDKQVMKSKTHGTVARRFNHWARLGNTDPRYAELRNNLERLRGPARYLRGEFGLGEEAARHMLATLKEMQQHVEDVAPRRVAVQAS